VAAAEEFTFLTSRHIAGDVCPSLDTERGDYLMRPPAQGAE
jgi:hypothetical protein